MAATRQFLRLVTLAATGLLFGAPVAAETVFKCTDASGKVQFMDQPCAGDAKTQQSLEVQNRPSYDKGRPAQWERDLDTEGKLWKLTGGPVHEEGRGKFVLNYVCLTEKGDGSFYESLQMICDESRRRCRAYDVYNPRRNAGEERSMNLVATGACLDGMQKRQQNRQLRQQHDEELRQQRNEEMRRQRSGSSRQNPR